MSQQESSKPVSVKSALTPGQPALSPQRLLKLLRLLPLISVLVSTAIITHQHTRRNSLRAQVAQATKELDALEKREAELHGAPHRGQASEGEDHDHTQSP